MFYEQVKSLVSEPFNRLTGVKPETFGFWSRRCERLPGGNASQVGRASLALRISC
jgi:hypothetical protein